MNFITIPCTFISCVPNGDGADFLLRYTIVGCEHTKNIPLMLARKIAAGDIELFHTICPPWTKLAFMNPDGTIEYIECPRHEVEQRLQDWKKKYPTITLAETLPEFKEREAQFLQQTQALPPL